MFCQLQLVPQQQAWHSFANNCIHLECLTGKISASWAGHELGRLCVWDGVPIWDHIQFDMPRTWNLQIDRYFFEFNIVEQQGTLLHVFLFSVCVVMVCMVVVCTYVQDHSSASGRRYHCCYHMSSLWVQCEWQGMVKILTFFWGGGSPIIMLDCWWEKKPCGSQTSSQTG